MQGHGHCIHLTSLVILEVKKQEDHDSHPAVLLLMVLRPAHAVDAVSLVYEARCREEKSSGFFALRKM